MILLATMNFSCIFECMHVFKALLHFGILKSWRLLSISTIIVIYDIIWYTKIDDNDYCLDNYYDITIIEILPRPSMIFSNSPSVFFFFILCLQNLKCASMVNCWVNYLESAIPTLYTTILMITAINVCPSTAHPCDVTYKLVITLVTTLCLPLI